MVNMASSPMQARTAASCPTLPKYFRGEIAIRMDNGYGEVFRGGGVMKLTPGHGARTVGNRPCEFVDFSTSNCYCDDVVKK